MSKIVKLRDLECEDERSGSLIGLGDILEDIKSRSPKYQSEDFSKQWGQGFAQNLRYYQYEEPWNEKTPLILKKKDITASSEKRDNQIEIKFDPNRNKFSWRRLWQFTGPAWLMSTAYIDPGNLEGNLQSGAQAGYELIWVLWWATCAGCCMQILSSRLGIVTGKHMAEICRLEFSKPVGMLLWFFTELAIIGSDLQEIVGSAVAFQLLFGISLPVGCLITALDTFTFMHLHRYGVRRFEYFFVFLIMVMAAMFGWNFFWGGPEWSEIGKGWLIPRCQPQHTQLAVGLVGAIIMPHCLFLHSALVHSRKIESSNKDAVIEANFYFTVESCISLFVSFLINTFVVSVFAKGFFMTEFSDAIGLKDAGEYLKDRFGTIAMYLWGIGLLAAGQSSTMTGTFAGQYCMQGFLNINWPLWKRTLVTRSIALFPALLVAILYESYLDELDEWLNVQQSLQLPFALIPLILFNSSERIMGEFKLSKRAMYFFVSLALFIMGINMYLTFVFVRQLKSGAIKWAASAVIMLLYFTFMYLLLRRHVSRKS